jgi:hypothetical protein
MFARRIRPSSSARIIIHFASTSSESGSFGPYMRSSWSGNSTQYSLIRLLEPGR